MTESTYITRRFYFELNKFTENEELYHCVKELFHLRFYRFFKFGNGVRFMSKDEIKNEVVIALEYITTFDDILDGRTIYVDKTEAPAFEHGLKVRTTNIKGKSVDFTKLENYFHDLMINNDKYIDEYNIKTYPFLYKTGKLLYYR